MLLFRQQTGELVSILLDEGHLTDTRTAVAGAIAAKHLAPSEIDCIGIVGTGIQARLQLSYLKNRYRMSKRPRPGRGRPQLQRFADEA